MKKVNTGLLIGLVLFTAGCLTACQTARQANDYYYFPLEEALAKPSDEQKYLIELEGVPDIVCMKKPFGTYLWVYCKKGTLFEFDGNGAVLGDGKVRGSDLCVQPAVKP